MAAHADELPDDCNIENISAGGLFLRTSTPMPVGMPVRVELTKPNLKAPIVVTGRVVSIVTAADAKKHEVPQGVGIELDPLTGDTQRRYYAMLRDLGLKDLAAPFDPEDLHGTASPDTATVASNVRGLLDMLTDALHRVKERDEEIAGLKDKIRKLELELKNVKR